MIKHSFLLPIRRLHFPFKRSFLAAPLPLRVLVVSVLALVICALAVFTTNLDFRIVVSLPVAMAAAFALSFIAARTRQHSFKRVLVVGEGPLSAILSASLQQSSNAGRILGLRLNADAFEIVRELTIQEALSRYQDEPRGTVVVAEAPSGIHWRRGLSESHDVRVIPASDVLERLTGRLALDLAHADSVINEREREHVLPVWFRLTKRTIDLAAAIGLGLVVFPIVGLIETWCRLANRSSALWGETCAGREQSPFSFWRIQFQGSSIGRSPLQADQPRLFQALDRLHLDLAPSLLNLLKGDVSLVGPQPESLRQAQSRSDTLPSYKLRFTVSPGLTGWAQLKLGSADRQPPRSLEYDLYYIKHASLLFDLRILAATIAELTSRIGFRARRTIQRTSAELAAPPAEVVIQREEHSTVISVLDPRLADDSEPTLIVGAGDGGTLLLNEMRRNRSWSFWPVAFADDDLHKIGISVQGVPVVGRIAEIPEIVARLQIKIVVIAIPSASEAALNRIGDIARQSPARVLTMPNIGALLRGEETVRSLRDATIDDVLGRKEVSADLSRCHKFISGRRVLITGAAGSIGSEVARQVANLDPELILAVDVNESGMFDLCQELGLGRPQVEVEPIPASVTNRIRLAQTFDRFRPDIVFHAAAYKHVPMMEEWPEEAVMVNAVGSARVAQVAASFGVKRFVLVSTDKAVRPASVMGATKRLAELAIRAVGRETGLSTCCVRFGNVLGSRGSVIPIFERQINAGGPVTVTDPGMMRFFMTIPEAASLITEAGAMGHGDAIYMLEMGEEVSILELARRMIRLSGREEGRDIEIVFTGLRPGEKLREELSAATECSLATDHRKIRLLRDTAVGRPSADLLRDLHHIEQIACIGDHRQLRSMLFNMIDEKQPRELYPKKLYGHRSGGPKGRPEMQPAC